MDVATETVHATCIALGHRGVLLRGPSGCGKSDLALRCLALGVTPLTPLVARLVADDRVALRVVSGRVIASVPPVLAGKVEVRGIGIRDVARPPIDDAVVVLIVDLTPDLPVERLPDPLQTERLLGIGLPVLRLRAHETSAALKVLLGIDTYGVAVVP